MLIYVIIELFVVIFSFSNCHYKLNSLVEQDSIDLRKRAIFVSDIRKWNLPIKYYIDNHYLSEWYVQDALNKIQAETCIKFKRVYSKIRNEHGLNFVYSRSCGSHVGRIDKVDGQDVYINDECYYDVVRIQGCVFRALGMANEESRGDRDSYVKIHNENIIPGKEQNFIKDEKGWSTFYNISYDYGSSLHSLSKAFSRNWNPTITSKMNPKYEEMMGQRHMVAFSDYKLLNLHYCSNKCKNIQNYCRNDGYQNPNSCNTCKCPHNFEEPYCIYLKNPGYNCGEQELYAKLTKQQLYPWGAVDCYYRIRTEFGKRIALQIMYVHAEYTTICHEKYGIEIKHRKDKGVMGLCLCGYHYGPFYLKSEDDIVLVHHIGWRAWHKIEMYYIQIDKSEVNATLEQIHEKFK